MITGITGETPPPGGLIYAAPYAPAGPVVFGTSDSSVSIATGPHSFVMNEFNLGFNPGMRVRAAVTGTTDQWIEGVVTAFDFPTNTLTFTADITSGAGAYADWSVNIAGQPGPDRAHRSAGRRGASRHAGRASRSRRSARRTRPGRSRRASRASRCCRASRHAGRSRRATGAARCCGASRATGVRRTSRRTRADR